MKICMISGSYPNIKCGVGDYTARLCEFFKKQGIKIDIITSKDKEIEPKFIEDINVSPCVLDWGMNGWKIIKPKLKEIDPDIINIQFPTNIKSPRSFLFKLLPLLIKISGQGAKIFFTIHEFERIPKITQLKLILALWFSDRIIVVNELDLILVKKFLLFNRKKVSHIPIGSNILPIGRQGKSKEDFRKILGLDVKDKLILFFGYLNPDKGFDTLLQALAGLKSKCPDIKLLVLSEQLEERNDYHKKIKDEIERLNIKKDIIWVGFCTPKQVSQYFYACDVCALPFTEGAFLRRGTLLAAIVHQTPVVSTYSPRSPSKLKNEQNILLISPRNSLELQKALYRLLTEKDLQEEICQNLVKLAKDFSWEDIAQKYIQLFKS